MKPLLVICAIFALAAPDLAFAKPPKDRGGNGGDAARFMPRDRDDDDGGGNPNHGRGKPDKGDRGGGGGNQNRGGGGGGGGGNQNRGYGGQAAGPRRQVPLDQVINQIRRRSPGGRLLDASLEGGGRYYRVVWATADGRRIDYLVDAETGAILSERD